METTFGNKTGQRGNIDQAFRELKGISSFDYRDSTITDSSRIKPRAEHDAVDDMVNQLMMKWSRVRRIEGEPLPSFYDKSKSPGLSTEGATCVNEE